jgi:hypothetical protein
LQLGNTTALEHQLLNCESRWHTACVVNIRTNALSTTLAANHTPNSFANRAAVMINSIRHPQPRA